MLRRVLGETLRLELRPTPALWQVLADPGQVEQILMNLAVNARDAMPAGGEIVFATHNVDACAPRAGTALELAPPDDFVRLDVTDSGSGMSADVQSRIFEPFFTTKAPGKGTGLGLATVYGIVKQSGGFIACASEPGRGTTFSVYLPRHRAAVTDAPARVAPPLQPAEADAQAGAILVVEDEAAVREVVERILRSAGYAVLCARDGAEALALAEEHHAKLVLVLRDVVMPVMGGAELRRRLAAQLPELEVVFMSGYPDDLATSTDDAVTVLAKPFSASRLLAKVRERIEARRLLVRAAPHRSVRMP